MAGCLALTLPLEFVFSARVYRRPRRLLAAVLPPAVVFLAWDVVAIALDHWWFNPRYVTGWELPGSLPVEEVSFFVAIPLCTLLTYESVQHVLDRWQARSA
jgi:lycopene cyclase domain-containing protein